MNSLPSSAATATTTAAINIERSPVTLNLTARMADQPFSRAAQSFLSQLDSLSFLFSDQVEEIACWRQEFKLAIQNQIQDVTVEEEQERFLETALLMGAFLYDYLYPAICGNLEKDRQLLNLEEALKELLKLTIPQGQSVEQFIAEYETLMDEEQLLQESLAQINQCFQTQMEVVYRQANDSNQKIKERFEKIKRSLSAMIEHRQQKENETEEELSALAAKVALLQNRLEGLSLMAQESGLKSDAQQREYLSLLIECESMMKKI